MNEQDNVVAILTEIKGLLSQTKKTLNVEDLSRYTGLSKSKIYKLTQSRLIQLYTGPAGLLQTYHIQGQQTHQWHVNLMFGTNGISELCGHWAYLRMWK